MLITALRAELPIWIVRAAKSIGLFNVIMSHCIHMHMMMIYLALSGLLREHAPNKKVERNKIETQTNSFFSKMVICIVCVCAIAYSCIVHLATGNLFLRIFHTQLKNELCARAINATLVSDERRLRHLELNARCQFECNEINK